MERKENKFVDCSAARGSWLAVVEGMLLCMLLKTILKMIKIVVSLSHFCVCLNLVAP